MENLISKLEYAVLGSGSSANSYVWKWNDKLYVVDNGFSCKEFERRLSMLSLKPENIELIFLTHTHGDHIKGIDLLANRYDIPVVAHEKIDFDFHFKRKINKLEIVPEKEYPFREFSFTAFKTMHDASHSLGFHFKFPACSITLITDTGKVTPEMIKYAKDSDYLFLEANYSKEMLSNGSYPERLKKRISSNKGHLSNDDAALFMQELHLNNKDRIKKIYLCHLSKNNNHPDVVYQEISSHYNGDIPWQICRRDELVCSGGLDLKLL